jgi:hypothetical protein
LQLFFERLKLDLNLHVSLDVLEELSLLLDVLHFEDEFIEKNLFREPQVVSCLNHLQDIASDLDAVLAVSTEEIVLPNEFIDELSQLIHMEKPKHIPKRLLSHANIRLFMRFLKELGDLLAVFKHLI